ncbi:MAG: DUF2252 family protein [Polyangiaceae bacterium]
MLPAIVGGLVFAGACAEPKDPRAAVVIDVLAKADEPLIRARPALVASKYTAMRASAFAFYRGSFPLYLRDARVGDAGRTRFDVEGLFPLAVGDAHPENFGVLQAGDGSYGLEPNDFDGSDRYPWLWQLRRLTIGMVLASRSAGSDAEADVVRATVDAYASAVSAYGAGAQRTRVTEPGSDVVIADLFERANEDGATHAELSELTTVDGTGERRLLRGAFDDGQKFLEDVPAVVDAALPGTLDRYRETLLAPPPPAFFRVKDAAREYGAGIASLARVRVLILVEGPTSAVEDDVLLELKELADSGAGGFGASGFVADSPGERVLSISRRLWAIPNAAPLWGVSDLLGLPVQVRAELAGEKGIKLKRLEGERATPEALSTLGATLGALLARLDAAGSADGRGVDDGTIAAITATVGRDRDRFVDEQVAASIDYADRVEADWQTFIRALDDLGPRLGVPVDPSDAPDADTAALIGAPP